MSKYTNCYSFKTLLKLPIIPHWSKEKIAKYTYLRYVELLDKAKVLNKLDGANSLLEQYFIYDHLHHLSQPIFFFSACYSIKKLFTRRISIPKRLIYPTMILIPAWLLSSALYNMKNMIHTRYIKTHLLKTENENDLNEYLRFTHYYTNI